MFIFIFNDLRMCCYLSLLSSAKVNSCDAMADMLKGLVTRYEAKNKDSGRNQSSKIPNLSGRLCLSLVVNP
jgi:hypothetical protein